MTGLSILLLDTEPRTHNRYIVLALADALRRNPAVARVRLAGHGDALAAFHDEGLDTVLAVGTARTHAPLLGRLTALARTSILWTTEDPYEREANVRGSTGFSLVFTNDRASVAGYGGRARHLPLAASSLFHDLAVIEDDRRYLYDLLFIGTAWPNRVASLDGLLGRLPPSLKVKLALPWNEYIGPPDLDDDSLVTDWRCGNRDFALLANRSRVVLTLPRAFSASRTDQATGSTPPPRLFETALAGGFQVVVSPEPEVAEYYRPGAEIALCADEGEAAEAISAALAGPERRIAAARAARERTRREHLYDARVATIVEAVAARPPAPRRLPDTARPRTILMVSHNRAGYRAGGGVEIYQEILAGLGEGYRVLFLFPVLGDGRWSLRLEGPGIAETHACGVAGLPRLTDPHVEGLFERILFEQRVDLVHIHHLLHLPLGLPLIARACGVPVVYHLHDHHLICERWLLLDHAGRFCDVVHRGRDQCDACLAAASNYPPGSKARRDGFAALVAGAVDAFVTSTPGTGAYLRAFFPEIAAEAVVEIEMIAPGEAEPVPRPAHPPAREPGGVAPLVVAVPGNFTQHKGGTDIVELIRTCRDYPIRFKVLGRNDEPHRGRLAGLPPDQVVVTGGYEQQAVGALLAGCDVSLHLSTWPETFVIALTEAWRAGLVPVVTDIGALGERVADGIDGFTVPPHDPGAVRARLLELHFDRGRLARMRAAAARKRFVSVEAHLDAVRALYERLIAARPCPHDRVPDRLEIGTNLSLEALGLRVNAPSWADEAILWDGAPWPSEAPAASPSVAVIAALPPAHHGLPVARRRESGAAWSLDRMVVDDGEAGSEGGPVLVRRSLDLRGWLEAAGPAPQRTYLRLRGEGTTTYAALHPESRPDVAGRLVDPAAAAIGFAGRLDLGGVPFGFHALDLVHAGPAGLLEVVGLPSIFADPREAAPARFAPEGRAPADRPAAPLMAVRQSLPEAGGVVLASPGRVWAFEARIEGAPPDDRGMPLALLRDSAGRAWSVPAERAGENGLRVTALVPQMEPGAGEIGFAAQTSDGLVWLGRPYPVEIVPRRQHFRDSRALPDAFPVRFSRKVRRGPTLDAVSRETGAAGERVHCRGWAFVEGLGAPVGALALWHEGGLRACIAAGLQRPDVAAHLASPEAMACGFELSVPPEALARGRVRFLQRYARRTVEFTGFQTALRRAIAGP